MIKPGARHGKARTLQKAQGLVEYSLILVLVAVVVIVVTAVLGEDVRTVYCEVVQDINSDIDAPLCPGTADDEVADDSSTEDDEDDEGEITVTCNPSSGATVSGTVAPSASVTDTAGDNDIDHVSFSVSGPGVSYSWTEYQVMYCAFHGNGPCESWVNRSGHPLNSGSYSMSVTAHDSESHTGSCSTTFTVSP